MTDKATEDTALTALNGIIGSLTALDENDRNRILATVNTFFQQPPTGRRAPLISSESSPAGNFPRFASDESMTPKQFIMEKQPRSDVERVACLAYYLAHYRDMPHFKTIEITKLNTEAAQPKFSNAAKSTGNAAEYGYLAPASSGKRQLSAAGELFVQALPNRDEAKAAMAAARPRKSRGSGRKRATPSENSFEADREIDED